MTLPLLHLFVYGSLKRGFDNHNRFCRGVRSMEAAHIEGRLYQLPTGYPVLRLRPRAGPGPQVPNNRFLGRGSADLLADVDAQEQIRKEVLRTGTGVPTPSLVCRSLVHGVILTFANPAERLREIDGLEEFLPGRPSRYERVLIGVYSRLRQQPTVAWTYVAGDLSPRGRLIPTGRWNG